MNQESILGLVINLAVTLGSIYCYHLLVIKRAQEKLKAKNAQHLYEPLNDMEDQIKISEPKEQFNNIGNISTEEFDGDNLQQVQMATKINQVQKSNEDLQIEQIKMISQNLKEIEEHHKQQFQEISNEQSNMNSQIVDLSNQFQQLRLFFEGKITEQIQIYSQTSQKLEQLDDLSQHFQTQISLVKQEQTKELIQLNEKLNDFNTNSQKTLINIQEQLTTLQEAQIHETESQKQQISTAPQASTQPTQGENNTGKPGLTRQVQEIGQLKKQPTYKKPNK